MADRREDPIYSFAAQVLSSIYHGSETIPTPEELTHDNICFALDKLDGHLNRSHSQEETKRQLIEAEAKIEALKDLTSPDISRLLASNNSSVQILCEALDIPPKEAVAIASKIFVQLRNQALVRLQERKRAES